MSLSHRRIALIGRALCLVGIFVFVFTGRVAAATSVERADEAPAGDVLINDTYTPLGRNSANFFVVEEVDGEREVSALDNVDRASRGKSGVISWRASAHRIQAGRVRLSIAARRWYSMPVQYLVRPNLEVADTVEFNAEPGATYLVRGRITDDAVAVWLEDLKGKRVTTAITKGTHPSLPAPLADDAVAQFNRTSPGELQSVLLRRLGRASSEGKKPGAEHLLQPDAEDRIDYHYDGLGTVRLLVPRETQREPFVIEVIKVLPSTPPAATSADCVNTGSVSLADAVTLIVTTGDANLLRGIAQGLLTAHVTDVPTLDTLAARVWRERDN